MMLPADYCADCGAKLDGHEQVQYLDVCRDCYEEWAAYLAQLAPQTEAV